MHLNTEALILDLQRMSTEDGPGLRTTLFFKGCNLRCDWCHNPESIQTQPVVRWNGAKCIGCRTCKDICTAGALIENDSGIDIDNDLCRLCLDCVGECPSGALTVKGERYEGEKLLADLIRDRAYFGEEGGITLSGGEPLLQPEAALWLLARLKELGVHTALDTAGLIRQDLFTAALENTDLLLYDLKLADSAAHEKHTGRGNERILENFKHAVRIAAREKMRLWVRTPIIPGATDSPENVAAIGAFITAHGADRVERWELCAFNNLCINKYHLLGRTWLYENAGLMSRRTMEQLRDAAAAELGGSQTAVMWTGSVALEKAE